MNDILFFDLEVDEKSKKILEIGAIFNGQSFRSADIRRFDTFSKQAKIACGHNIFEHDLFYLKKHGIDKEFLQKNFIDTLLYSPLLFPNKPYHKLVKDYRLLSDFVNDPVADSKATEALLHDLIKAWHSLPVRLSAVYSKVLGNVQQFEAFIQLMNGNNYSRVPDHKGLSFFIKENFRTEICKNTPLENLLLNHPAELCYALALISSADAGSITPPWLLNRFPAVNEVIYNLRATNCKKADCLYCNEKLDARNALKRYFGFDSFRRYDKDTEVPLQERAVDAALADQSLLAIFPTGGGKSLTFQLPALIRGDVKRALTVVISPLVSLMKDQVDVLLDRHEIHEAVAINGLLSPLERAKAIELVAEGGVSLLYISPEALRSRTIFSLLKGRSIDRFVIDEAHCFSTWGQDFRVDYLYIGKFINKIQGEKGLLKPIPVSCFTATAKPSVIKDISDYFKETLNLDLELFHTGATRKNLHYSVYEITGQNDKLQKLKSLLLQEEGPKIIYVSRIKTCEKIIEFLKREGIAAESYHGKMDSDGKKETQDAFIKGELEVIVATNAFGMGVDKDNVKMVIHFDISNSLENYMQESGRAGRKPELEANCYILFDENDLNEHFSLLNATKLNQKEIDQIWTAIKAFKKAQFTKSALEIAKRAGWDTEMRDLETKVKTAIAALEDRGYINRGLNATRVFAQSILVKNIEEANKKINENTYRFSQDELVAATRIFQNIISRDGTGVDRIAEVLGIPIYTVAKCLSIFKELDLLGDARDLTAFIDVSRSKKNSVRNFQLHARLEEELLSLLLKGNDELNRREVYLKELNEQLIEAGIEQCTIESIRHILQYWKLSNYVDYERTDAATWHYKIQFKSKCSTLSQLIKDRLELANNVIHELVRQFEQLVLKDKSNREIMEFSVLELKRTAEKENLFGKDYPLLDYEQVLLYLHIVDAIKLEGGLLIFYNPMIIDKLEDNPKKRYTKGDYSKFENHYEKRIEQIHIIGEYAKKQLSNHLEALKFVDDYFTLEYEIFIKRYFGNTVGKIKQPITDKKFKEIFQSLDQQQSSVINDKENERILVAAGPGSGKTRVLVHKVAAILMLTDTKPDQFLMLTFSRPAAMEFKERLQKLIGPAAYHIDINTYHSYAFNLIGRMGDLDKAERVIPIATKAIRDEDIPQDKIAGKTVIVVDEYQDIDQEQYEFLQAIIEHANDPTVIVVGDDDQNIYEFRGSSVQYMYDFVKDNKAKLYYLNRNYRAKKNLVQFSNQFLSILPKERMKNHIELEAKAEGDGKIKIVKHVSNNLISPIVEEIINSEFAGSTAVLVSTNERALLCVSLLLEKGIPAKLITNQEGFSLRDISELRYFTKENETSGSESGFISEEEWNKNIEKLKSLYNRSSRLQLAIDAIQFFEKVNPSKFLSDWKAYLREIRSEDLLFPDDKTILVSTMHKVKGKEFDNVLLMLDDFELTKAEKQRVVYVAITRAKSNLIIHTNMNYLDNFNVSNLLREINNINYPIPKTIILQAGLKDVRLNFFQTSFVKTNVKKVVSGDSLKSSVNDQFAFASEAGNNVSKLSAKYEALVSDYFSSGYKFKKVEAGYTVIWKCLEDGLLYKVILPKIWLERDHH